MNDTTPLLARTFDELDVGECQVTRRRTLTEADVVTWCAYTGDSFWLHTDAVAAGESMFGQRIVPGIMVFAYATGLGVPPGSATILANYGTDRLRYPRPTLIGDSIRLEIEVVAKDERDAGTGIVTFRWDAVNQNDVTVCASQLKVLMARRPASGATS
ncbi:MaoC/PaaZ C-terminal domain-containing protein [Dactylosporangium sp. AC04546]|uniref:MaoC family dehydratase n=1 Tax=Dactylosporangium sp. AC04546 TaxID=2862460 RepID=UPI001EDF79F7|nr:MaoC/PaaZ C-terminal domain-containing protein [Dactylosporangium sp. AC04546]WVK88992.1 MaoC/PaaZ C-terminal domain-containing protein [Dactylosporangium sp. AC04546]